MRRSDGRALTSRGVRAARGQLVQGIVELLGRAPRPHDVDEQSGAPLRGVATGNAYPEADAIPSLPKGRKHSVQVGSPIREQHAFHVLEERDLGA
eukprot:2994760-Alexandrium_andersonii.AAC.1